MKWISVKDKLPEKEEKVLTIFKSKKDTSYNCLANGWFRDELYSAKYDGDNFIILPHGPRYTPTHWMPLPEEPNEVD